MRLFTPKLSLTPMRRSAALLGLSACLLLPALAWAQSEVQKLVNDGKHAQALKLIDAQLAKTPKDPQLQFQRGVVLSMLARRPEALETFKKLVAENPNMAPAYNNMAVIYAAMSDYENAKSALDKAIKISPDYATAYQNLGDVYVQFATQAYQKSISLDKSDPTVPPKVALLREVLNPGSEKAASPEKAAGDKTAADKTAGDKPPADKQASAKPLPPARAAASAAAAKPADATSANASAEVSEAVRAWAAAWSNRDAAAYIAFYAPDFKGSAKSREAWERERTERITQRSRIKVSVSDLVVSAIGDKAEVRFRQSYESDGPKETSHKVLNLSRGPGGQWLIVKEASGG